MATYTSELDNTVAAVSGTSTMPAQNDYGRIDEPNVWVEYCTQGSIVTILAIMMAIKQMALVDSAQSTKIISGSKGDQDRSGGKLAWVAERVSGQLNWVTAFIEQAAN